MLNLRYIKKLLQDSFQFFLERLFITVSAINCKVIRNNTRRRERIKWKRANAIFLCTYIQFSFPRFIFTFPELRMFQLIHWISQLVVNHSAAWLHTGKTKVTKRYYWFFLIVYCCLCVGIHFFKVLINYDQTHRLRCLLSKWSLFLPVQTMK